jgi:hypothetical protein
VPRNSIGVPQIKRNAVTSSKIAPNSVRTAHVVNGSLLAEDFKPNQIPQGPKGDRGERGDRGATGPVGISGYEIVRVQQTVSALTTLVSIQAACPEGKKVIGGTGNIVGFNASGVFLDLDFHDSAGFPGDTTVAVIVSNTNTTPRAAEAVAICARVAT